MKKSALFFVFRFLMLASLAAGPLGCAPAIQGGQPTSARDVPSDLPPTDAPAPVQGSLGSITTTQSGKAPDYTTNVEIPVMNGSNDPSVVAFNKAANQLVQEQVQEFQKALKDVSIVPIVNGSSLTIKYTPFFKDAQTVSLQLNIDQYMDGAAHPFNYTVSMNYDLQQGRQLALAELFLPGSNYLQVLSEYSISQLGRTDIADSLDMEALSPKPENFQRWNIGAEGLVLTFDPYQVAPYAAGPQVVTIGYSFLESLINPQGPLAGFVK